MKDGWTLNKPARCDQKLNKYGKTTYNSITIRKATSYSINYHTDKKTVNRPNHKENL